MHASKLYIKCIKDPLQAGLEEEGHIHESQQDWHFHQRPNGGSQRLWGQDPKGPRSDGNGQLEVVGGGREGLRDCLLVARSQAPGSDDGAHKHDEEVEAHGHCNAADAANVLDYLQRREAQWDGCCWVSTCVQQAEHAKWGC